MVDLEELIEHSKNLKILYVEDNQDTREMTTMMLEDFFQTIILSTDGEDGFNKFREHKVDLVLTDINMPKLNGLELCRKIREIDKNIPLIVLSAHNETNYFEDSEEIGVDGYLLKPIDIEQLANLLYNVIKKIEKKGDDRYDFD
ncbi:MAG: response regulator [Epsilonproteobacteria bacterium]|nr:response regulator [Campylobacterota bacterium]